MKGGCETVISTEPYISGQAKSQELTLAPSGKCQDQNQEQQTVAPRC